ncbi:MAG TPA: hypothetical protein VFM18_14940 [Methanosarcina sp.]|nr:hypothetical protein [Methanosarcina sp.]
MTKRQLPEKFGIFEKIPQYCSAEHPILFGPYSSREEAEKHRVKYGYTDDNFYVDVIKRLDNKA